MAALSVSDASQSYGSEMWTEEFQETA